MVIRFDGGAAVTAKIGVLFVVTTYINENTIVSVEKTPSSSALKM
jgi:hypothetical protein